MSAGSGSSRRSCETWNRNARNPEAGGRLPHACSNNQSALTISDARRAKRATSVRRNGEPDT